MTTIINYSIIFLTLIMITSCNNLTGKYNMMKNKDFQLRQNRLISFNTQDDGDISMELAFNVPFITIPVKKSIDMAQGAMANINLGAIILGGAIVFGFAIVIPGILALISKKSFSPLPNLGYRREDSQVWNYLNLLDGILTENDIDTTSCFQKIICLAVKTSADNVQNGASSSTDKIIDGLATNKWLQEISEGTVIYSALQNGLNRTDCSQKYHHCKVDEKSMNILAQKFSNKN